MIGAIEAGGTKMVCAVGDTYSEIRDGEKFVVPTTTPDETLAAITAWFRAQPGTLDAIGVASFGPIDYEYGAIAATTPKVSWRNVSWRDELQRTLGPVPVGFDTDTNAAAWAESRWGATTDCGVSSYVTVGTGIGGGLVVDGNIVHGLLHPEFGHMVIRRNVNDTFAGSCVVHGDCLEGLASGRSIEMRWDLRGSQLASDHVGWEYESDYLAMAMVNVITLTASERIVLGGGVMGRPGLLEHVRAKTSALLAGYVDAPALRGDLSNYLVAPGLGAASGIVGAFALGRAECAA